ncbi:hypothetical protein RRSWK_03844 [Rhodopirellula sp. SWK7]|nr:hypothetical protein RRSWK_03844 [Rhodopirellula sp. SWK7]
MLNGLSPDAAMKHCVQALFEEQQVDASLAGFIAWNALPALSNYELERSPQVSTRSVRTANKYCDSSLLKSNIEVSWSLANHPETDANQDGILMSPSYQQYRSKCDPPPTKPHAR